MRTVLSYPRRARLFSALLLIMAVTLGGCTHNNGDIGPLFGNWKLQSVETDLEAYQPAKEEWPIFWAFQSTTIRMAHISETNSLDQRFGNYRLDDNTLFLDFPDSGDNFRPLLHLPDRCEMQVLKLTSKQLVLEYNPTENEEVIYTFRKW